MAISAQYFDVIPIAFPIGKTARPTILALFGRKLFASVYVIQVQYANIAIPTLHALTAQFLNQFKLALPRSALFVEPVPIQIPKGPLTFWGTELCRGWFPTLVASTVLTPSTGVIARLRAILGFAYSVGTDIEQRTAISARSFFAGRLSIRGNTLKSLIPRRSTGKRFATLRPATPRAINLFLTGFKLNVTRGAYMLVHSMYFTINRELANADIARARIAKAAEQARQLTLGIEQAA